MREKESGEIAIYYRQRRIPFRERLSGARFHWVAPCYFPGFLYSAGERQVDASKAWKIILS
jgi:hypothetical protein